MAVLYPEKSYRIIGACFKVHKDKGCGFLESVYQECLQIELRLQNIPFIPQPRLQLSYKGVVLSSEYIPGFFCFQKIIVELKAVSELANEHRAQVHNYLKATGHRLGLLINFRSHPKLVCERIVR